MSFIKLSLFRLRIKKVDPEVRVKLIGNGLLNIISHKVLKTKSDTGD